MFSIACNKLAILHTTQMSGCEQTWKKLSISHTTQLIAMVS